MWFDCLKGSHSFTLDFIFKLQCRLFAQKVDVESKGKKR